MKKTRLLNKKSSAVIAAALALLMLLFAFSSFADDDIWGEGTTAAETAQNTTNEAAFEDSETASYSKADFYLRIGIYYMNSAVSSLELSSNDGFILAECKRDGFTEIKDLRGYKTLKAVPAGKTTDIYDADGNLICSGISGYQGLISAAPEKDSRIVTAKGKEYRDGFVFGGYGNGVMAAANYVTLEHYVWGVLPREMGYTAPAEALKAQAVCARSFALSNLNKHGGGALDFDLCTGSHCQVYGAAAAEKDASTACCRDTEGLILSYDGEVCCTYYHAYNFGYTLAANQAWSSNIPYLQSVKDDYSSYHRWSTSFTFDELKTRLSNAGYKIGDITSVRVESRFPNGAVECLVFEGTGGTAKIRKNAILNILSLKSTGFSMAAGGAPEPKYGTLGVSGFTVLGSDGSAAGESVIYAVDSSGEISETAVSDAYALGSFGSSPLSSLVSYAAVFTDEVCDSGMIYLTGFGFGHCVGMCQTGAQNMAKEGFTYRQIMNYYFTDTELIHFSEADKL